MDRAPHDRSGWTAEKGALGLGPVQSRRKIPVRTESMLVETQRPSDSENTHRPSPVDGARTRRSVEFRVEVLDVGLDRVDRHVALVGDLSVGE